MHLKLAQYCHPILPQPTSNPVWSDASEARQGRGDSTLAHYWFGLNVKLVLPTLRRSAKQRDLLLIVMPRRLFLAAGVEIVIILKRYFSSHLADTYMWWLLLLLTDTDNLFGMCLVPANAMSPTTSGSFLDRLRLYKAKFHLLFAFGYLSNHKEYWGKIWRMITSRIVAKQLP